ncbi:iron-containing redox enzyme family protein [Salinarimonas rosea]|uniref:iron-containing redox enzyme family protein n=1 Tax=Salinarimonas rosea TaxID=552063 RepID=UPI00040132F6|nr:iron-containing redox enzyme family protein [Salinarimonas rosea]
MWRHVYRWAINPEVFLDAANLRDLVRQAGLSGPDGEAAFATPAAAGLEDARARLVAAVEGARASLAGLVGSARAQDGGDAGRRIEETLVGQSAPFAAALGAWLQGLSAPGVFEDETHLKILALLADDVGVGRPEASRADAFRLLARRAGLPDVAGSPRDLVALREIQDVAFRFPAVLFALSRRSDAFAPELAGIDLALRTTGLAPAFSALAALREVPELAQLDLARALTDEALPKGHTPLTLSLWIAARHADPEAVRRVAEGFAWGARGILGATREIEELAATAVDPRLAMALLVRERAREAAVYHQAYTLEGRTLDAWFEEAGDDPLPLVDALARSKLVRPTDPDRSALIGTLIRPNGPMFRIFRAEDVAVIRRWIASLAEPRPADGPDAPARLPLEVLAPRRGPISAGDATLGAVPATIRDAYHLLQGRALAPRTRAFALDYARFWLDAARRSIDVTDRSLPADWSPGRVRAWLLDSHDKNASAFEQHRGDAMPTREEVIRETLQLAPLTLIDGAWLQGFTETTLAATRVGFPLFATYWDELGNGDWDINHPKIYREVLAAMDIRLPPTGARAFADSPLIEDASFRLPVYWLCLGKFPVTLRPEILGMNLAMELSGVGGAYRSARRFLKHYGFPTLFVDLHNTIDNVSTGHSAWAADAIDAYMLAVGEIDDPEPHWERVRAGYESLAPIVKRPSELDYFRKGAPASAGAPAAFDLLHHAPVRAPAREAEHA